MDTKSIESFVKHFKSRDPNEWYEEAPQSDLVEMLVYLLDEIKLLSNQIQLTQIEYNNIKSTLKPIEEKVVNKLKCTFESGLYNED